MKVLIIDDETDLCLLLKSYILGRDKNYEVRISHSLKEGLANLAAETPDIVFLDNDLPDGAGWDKAPEIALKYPGIHINLISAYNPDIPPMPANAAYIVYEKPISLADLDRYFVGS